MGSKDTIQESLCFCELIALSISGPSLLRVVMLRESPVFAYVCSSRWRSISIPGPFVTLALDNILDSVDDDDFGRDRGPVAVWVW